MILSSASRVFRHVVMGVPIKRLACDIGLVPAQSLNFLLNVLSVCYSHLFRMQVYHLFGWFWIMNFIMALGMCALAGAFASYYWAWDKKTVSVNIQDFITFETC